MRLLPLLAAALTLSAGPALACRIPPSQFVAAFQEEPAAAPDGLVLHGRLVLRSEPLPVAADDATDEWLFDPSAIYHFGTLERRDGPPVRVYRSQFLSSCDITPPGIFEKDVWFVGRPLPDDGEGERVLLMVLRRSGVWGVE